MINQQIASTILAQLGGARFRAMTGARDFLAIERGLQFRLPSNFARDGINTVRITLDPSDTYTVRFLEVRGTDVTEHHETSGVYCDGLEDLFTRRTGLDTRLCRPRADAPVPGM